MPQIRSSTDLRNNYNEISSFCRESREPVFITKNGQGDLVIMSIETFEILNGKLDLYRLLDEGRTAAEAGRKRSYSDVFSEVEQEISNLAAHLRTSMKPAAGDFIPRVVL